MRFGERIGFAPTYLLASELMQTPEFAEQVEEIKGSLSTQQYAQLQLTVPLGKDVMYPILEIACVAELAKKGLTTKYGPPSEQAYDNVMRELELDVRFEYFRPAYALGTRDLHEVVPYVPTNVGPGGQRIYLDDPQHRLKSKIGGHEDAIRSVAEIARRQGELVGEDVQTREELAELTGKRLRKTTYRLICDHVVSV